MKTMLKNLSTTNKQAMFYLSNYNDYESIEEMLKEINISITVNKRILLYNLEKEDYTMVANYAEEIAELKQILSFIEK